MNKNFWKNKKVLVTGFEGFLGSHLVKALLTTQARVTGLDICTHRRETILASADYKRMDVYKGSVADPKIVEKILRRHAMDVIFHLAAEAIVSHGRENPARAFESNIQGTWIVLEAVRRYSPGSAVIVASSDKAYGACAKLPYKEDAPCAGNYPYDVSKSCADLIARTYFDTYRLPVAVTRCGNIYGPGDFHFSRIIPEAIRCALTGQELLIRSDGKFVRDYVYVDDIVGGYILLAEKLKKLGLAGEVFNLSDESPKTVMDVVRCVFKILGRRPRFKILNQAQHEIKEQYLASGKARKILGWRARCRFEEGLRRSIDWYKGYYQTRGGGR